MILGNSSPLYPIWALILVILSLIIVPRKDYQYLLPHGLLIGIVSGIFLIVTVNLIKAWNYVDVFPYSFLGISIFIIAAWSASTIIFLWALPEDLPVWTHYVYIALYAIIGVVIDSTFHNLGLRPYADWYKSWMWFIVVYIIFWINYKIYIIRRHFNR